MTDCRIYRGRPDEKVSCKWAIYRLPESMSAIDLEAVRSFYPYAGEGTLLQRGGKALVSHPLLM